jgi:Major Facilitator Superfamily
MPATLSLLTVAYPKEQRTTAVGIWAGVAGSGGVSGMLGSGLLLYFWDWQSNFWALGGAGAVLFLLAFTVSRSRDRDAPPVDWPGALLIGAAVAVFVFGILQAPAHGWTDAVIVSCNQDFTTGVATITVVFIATFGFSYLAMQYVQQVMGYSPLATAIAFSPMILPLGTLSAVSFRYLPELGLRLEVFAGMLEDVGRLHLHSRHRSALVLFRSSVAQRHYPRDRRGSRHHRGRINPGRGYSQQLTPRVTAFPQFIRGPVSGSLAQAIEIAWTAGNQPVGAMSAGANKLGRPVRDHHDRCVRTAAGDRGQDRSVDHP